MDTEIYVTRRNEALLSLDKNKLETLFTEAGVDIPEDETVFWAGIHMTQLQIPSFSAEVKAESLGWLHANGYAV